MRDAVVSVYENRKNLALTLKDTRTVVGKLENILGLGIHAICFLFYLSIFNVRPLLLVCLLLSTLLPMFCGTACVCVCVRAQRHSGQHV